MANKQAIVILPVTSVVAGLSDANPFIGPTADLNQFDGGQLTYKITNGASAPGVAITVVFQISHDGIDWFDFYTIGGTIVANRGPSNSLFVGPAVMYLRAIAYGNTTNAVTVYAVLQSVSR